MCKNILIILLATLLLNNCGYNPMYSKNVGKKYNIEFVSFDGDREINNSIKYNLKRYIDQNNELKFLIKTDSKYTKSSETKNLAGDAISYNLIAAVTFTVSYGENEKLFNFQESATINNLENQLDETTYETNIKRNFALLFTDRLILQLIKIK